MIWCKKVSACCSSGMLFLARAAVLGVVCAFGWNIAASVRHLCFLHLGGLRLSAALRRKAFVFCTCLDK